MDRDQDRIAVFHVTGRPAHMAYPDGQLICGVTYARDYKGKFYNLPTEGNTVRIKGRLVSLCQICTAWAWAK